MSSLRRFFVNKIENPLVVDGEEFRHAISVLRIKVGDDIIVCDNSGYEYTAKVTQINKKEFLAEIISKQLSNCEPTEKVTLIAGYLKGDKTELIVQKAVELGVSNIVVFDSQFSSSYINENKLARLNKVSVEAAKQCGRAVAPIVEYASTFDKALSYGESCENKLFACEFATKNEVEFSSLKGSTCVVVGSEGGFSESEYSLALSKNYKTIYLGKRILRAETACIALCAIIMNSLNQFN